MVSYGAQGATASAGRGLRGAKRPQKEADSILLPPLLLLGGKCLCFFNAAMVGALLVGYSVACSMACALWCAIA